MREAFTKSLIRHFVSLDTTLFADVEAALEQQDLPSLFDRIQKLLASFPYQLFIKAQEHTYHGFLLSLLSSMGLEVAAETPSSLGRVDLLVQVASTTYVIEVKLDSSTEEGLRQIMEKHYHMPHLGQGKAA